MILVEKSIYYCHQKGDIFRLHFMINEESNNNKHNNNQNLCVSVIENKASQCVSYQENVEVTLPKSKILFTDKHIINSNQFDRNLLRQIFLRSQEIMMTVKHNKYESFNQILENKIFGLLFFIHQVQEQGVHLNVP